MKSYNEILQESKRMTYDELYAYLEPYFIKYVNDDYRYQLSRYQRFNIIEDESSYISIHLSEVQIANCISVDEISEALRKEIEKVRDIYESAYNFKIYADDGDIKMEFNYVKVEDESTAISIAKNMLSSIVWKIINEVDNAAVYSVYNRVYQFSKED